ncbi:MAG: translation initiation factor IF-2 [Candidatus Puniceispirillaceae bacterium]
MIVKVQWIIDGVMEIDAETNEAAEALADEKLRSFIQAHPELTETLGATAIQGHAVTDDDGA